MLAETLPTTVPVVVADPANPWWVNAIIGVCGAIVGVLVALQIAIPPLRELIRQIGEIAKGADAKATTAVTHAAQAVGATDAIQETVTRVSSRQNAADTAQKLYMAAAPSVIATPPPQEARP